MGQRVGFRFIVAYVLLYTVPFPLDYLSLGRIGLWVRAGWMLIVPWVGAHVLALSHPVNLQQSGSGDKLFDWIQVLTMLGLAAIAAGVWTALDRGRRAYPRVLAWGRVYLRFYLTVVLYSYAFDKMFPNQFFHLDPLRLTKYVGEMSPGGYGWLFLGLSIPYEMFAGFCEFAAGTLLLFRRTETLGALFGAGVMANVFLLNMSFDVPVKLFSFHLFLFLCVLASGDARRLLNMFVFNRTVEPARRVPLIERTNRRRVAAALATLFVAWIVYQDVRNEWQGLHQFGILRPVPALAGIFEVDSVAKNGVVTPGLVTDGTRWRRIAMSGFSPTQLSAYVRMADDHLMSYGVRVDSVKHALRLLPSIPDTVFGTPAQAPYLATLIKYYGPKADSAPPKEPPPAWLPPAYRLAYAMPDHDHLVLRGRVGADSIEMRLHRQPESSYLLVRHGMFHWVNEVPFFR
ncbi:MAG TPA: hypothetical protein VHB25_00985 [Gemmatimonadaceae bacterium]|nr:hypothetical protein [Gemmatimonadaceae bacterium]